MSAKWEPGQLLWLRLEDPARRVVVQLEHANSRRALVRRFGESLGVWVELEALEAACSRCNGRGIVWDGDRSGLCSSCAGEGAGLDRWGR